ncbi:cell wall biogenesis and architecture protein [Mycoemilia scoparia]|uniref:3-methyl-2-oxobutanoate hydroxymethyltransferase n=1 Tax=Mycoemilia scoparia TaxID=417184 RepID=A0A9W8A112_9FUNG|nr:cell wall biogenesis and architecture protein [Mycoemilia scoparia]
MSHTTGLKKAWTGMSYSTRPLPPKSAATQGTGAAAPPSKVTIQTLKKLYKDNVPISVVTAYDYPSAVLAENSGIDVILVGDSLAMVALGYKDTSEITLDEMIHHTKAVSRGAQRPWLVADLPFGCYHASTEQAILSSVKMVKEGRAEAVKIEGGKRMARRIEAIVKDVGIPVVGHIGLTPQTAVSLGGFRVQGRTLNGAKQLVQDALALQEAGCSLIVLEAMPSPVAESITNLLDTPTIGIGAGPYTSGQVLVFSDMLGMFDRFMPKFCKQYVNMGQQIEQALSTFAKEVQDGEFPKLGQHTYNMPPLVEEQWKEFIHNEFGVEPTASSTTSSDSINTNKKEPVAEAN